MARLNICRIFVVRTDNGDQMLAAANALRIVLADAAEQGNGASPEDLVELACDIDDMSPELCEHVVARGGEGGEARRLAARDEAE